MISWQKIQRAKGVTTLTGVSFILVLGAMIEAYLTLGGATSPLIINFNRDAGVIQAGSLAELQSVGLIGVLMIAMNYLLALELDECDWLWGKLVSAVTLIIAILLFVGFQAIISVN